MYSKPLSKILNSFRNPHSYFIRPGASSLSLPLSNPSPQNRSICTNNSDDKKSRGNNSNKRHRFGAIIFGLGLSSLASVTIYQAWKKNKYLKFPTLNAASPVGAGGDGKSPGLRDKYNFIADTVENISPAVVYIKNSSTWRQSTGSGFIISSEGQIVTNAHVVYLAHQYQVQVHLPNGKEYTGHVQVVDSASDLALIKINEVNLPTIKLGQSDTLRPGEWVVAVGSPLSLSNTVTTGVVSSTGRKSSELGLRNDIDYIQTDAPITYGNSGGPLINLDGEAVGVNSMKIAEGISFAIPSNYVKKFMIHADAYQKGKTSRIQSKPPFVGIHTITLSPHLVAQLRNRPDIGELDLDRGLFVVFIDASSPAQQAGIQKHDVVMKVDDTIVDDHNDLSNAVRGKTVVKFTIYRQGAIKEIHVRPKS